MNGYERRKQKKIDQIYNVSLQLFSKYGYQKVSINEIAQMANVSPATIYNYFGTKEQLYADMLMNWMDKQLQQYENIVASGRSFPEKMKNIMLIEAKNLKIISDVFTQAASSEWSGLAQLMKDYVEEKVEPFFMKFVALGKQEGYIHRDLTEELTMMYFTMFKNEMGRYWEAGSEELMHRHADQFMELFFYGLCGQPREQK
ncbi:TetR/AcrR family transcriptional regulator [Paenibacillus sp. LHD-117]|uniref:TetR/AcrR family transcriptional regulator n=1 Tax=Paenibacillus sp. LHD-117 TaxID=3071412 RepID=UPI0027E1FC02|nr:TetR/AcrR family transcriptional regulator [Paenibacillus sp. LHD-117]MDQ6421963.1 TetR/AcrR family transcriptional regulator [Paenibacillus sp. LHD-117]